uniref:LIM zinc-binding domain-containing protein n=1 Tax=Ditylenchus dipsaci TaxID=166011 RepID=A0A915DTW9_9BILA
MFCSGPQIKNCKICGEKIAFADKIVIENHDLHKQCFTCGICDNPCKQGSCATDHVLQRTFGLMYFCHNHMMLGSGEKLELLKKRFPVLNQ